MQLRDIITKKREGTQLDRIVIVGGWISGLSLAYAILRSGNHQQNSHYSSPRKNPEERYGRENGTGFSAKVGGHNGLLDNKPKTTELSLKLLLNPLRSSDAARQRYIFSDNRLHLLA